MRNIFAKMLRALSFLRSRWFAVSLLCVLTALLMLWIPSRMNFVYIDSGGERQLVRTTEREPDVILAQNGVTPGLDDRVMFSGFGSGLFDNTAEISIVKTFPVEVLVDSRIYHVRTAGGSVSDVLYEAGVLLRNTDLVSMTPQTVVGSGDTIKVTRIDYRTKVEEEPIARDTVYKSTSLIANGRQRLLSYGYDGIKLLTYEQKYTDGVAGDMKLVSEDIGKVPAPDTYLVGTGEAISPLDFGYEIVDGRPANYKYVLENQTATGYSADNGAGTASGVYGAGVGYVAVDPAKIPYGTKLYITAHGGGSFVYGYAIAADTGSGLISGSIGVDLFYDTYYESVLNGLRYVDIYVLE